MKLTVDQYCKRFKMSKEMVHSKIRTKKVDCIVEDSQVFIIVDEAVEKNTSLQADLSSKEVGSKKPKTTVATVFALYQKENNFLKNKIAQLEAKIDKLIDDKEQMLRAERDNIERIYSSKDVQLKNILELVNKKIEFEQKGITIHEIDSFEDLNNAQDLLGNSEAVELKEYLKSLEIKSSQRKIIKKRFLDAYDSDVRIIHKEGKLYLDLSKYDYSDLLAC